MKVALVYPSWTQEYGWFGWFARRNSAWPPLNLALLGAIAEQHDHQVTIVDAEVEQIQEKDLVRQVLEIKPDLVGLTSSTPFFHINTSLAEALKKESPSLRIAIGGPHVTILREAAMRPCFDYLFVGEAEKSFPSFLYHLENGNNLYQVRGIIYRDERDILSTGPSDQIQDGGAYPLDQFPFPARHLLNMGKYRIGTVRGRVPFTTIQTTRGCPWRCIFCSSEALNTHRVIRRSPASVVAEIKSVVDTYGIRHFFFVDDVLTLQKSHITEICDRLDAEGIKITFEGGTRANLVDESLIKRLSQSGLICLSFGLEAVDAGIRRTMGKKIPLQSYLIANRLCEKYGVEARNSVMIGLPGETRETVASTLKFLRNAREVKQANFAIAVPYPGTEFYKMAKSGKHGIKLMTEDFSRYRRYGSAVTTVNGLSPSDLLDLQNEGFVRVYSAPWRWWPMFRKQGIVGLLITFSRLLKFLFRKARSHELRPRDRRVDPHSQEEAERPVVSN